MSTIMPQSHLYIFTEDQRDYKYTEEALTEEYMNFFEDITALFHNDMKLEFKPISFWDILKGIVVLIFACLISILLFIGLIVVFIAGLCIHCCKKTWQFFRNILKINN